MIQIQSPPPKSVLVTVRISHTQSILLDAVTEVRGDETRSDSVRAAIAAFTRMYIKPGEHLPVPSSSQGWVGDKNQ